MPGDGGPGARGGPGRPLVSVTRSRSPSPQPSPRGRGSVASSPSGRARALARARARSSPRSIARSRSPSPQPSPRGLFFANIPGADHPASDHRAIRPLRWEPKRRRGEPCVRPRPRGVRGAGQGFGRTQGSPLRRDGVFYEVRWLDTAFTSRGASVTGLSPGCGQSSAQGERERGFLPIWSCSRSCSCSCSIFSEVDCPLPLSLTPALSQRERESGRLPQGRPAGRS